MIVRKARLADVPTLIRLWGKFRNDHTRIVLAVCPEMGAYYARGNDTRSAARTFYEKNIRARNAAVLIALEGEMIVGHAMVAIAKAPPIYRVERLVHIKELFVLRPHRGKGVASALCRAAAAWGGQKGLKHISLNVSPYNEHARAVYKNWGFLDYQIEMRKKI